LTPGKCGRPVFELVQDLRARGITLRADGDLLRYRPASALSAEDVDRLRAAKVEVLALLRADGALDQSAAGGPPLEERRAVLPLAAPDTPIRNLITDYRAVLTGLYELAALGPDADPAECGQLLQEQMRLHDELGPEFAEAVDRQHAGAWAARTQRCPSCGLATQKRPPGPRTPDGWKPVFLEHLRQYGGAYKAARAAGVAPSTVWRQCDVDGAFAERMRDAREEFADTLEEGLAADAARTGNPVGRIVLLKKFRPNEYVEKYAVMNLNVSGELGSEEAASVLRAMLGDLGDSTRALLEGHPAAPALPEGDAAH
jgi:hypothetical protein